MQKSKLKIQIRQPQKQKTITNTKNKKWIKISPNKEKWNKQQPILPSERWSQNIQEKLANNWESNTWTNQAHNK